MRAFGRSRFLLASIPVLALLTAAPAVAQGGPQPATVTVTAGGVPQADVDIFLFASGRKIAAGATNAAGVCDVVPSASLEAAAVPPVGSTVTVWRRVCRDGSIEVILVPEGVNPTPDDLGCGQSGAAGGEDCECTRVGVVVWGPSTRIDIGALPQTGAGSTGTRSFGLDLRGGFKFSKIGGAEEACDTIVGELTDLNYTANIDCTFDQAGTGALVGGGVFLPVTRSLDMYAGVEFERLGSRQHEVANATRINVPGTSNLILSVNNETTVSLFNVDLGVAVSPTPSFIIVPYMTMGLASVSNVLVDRLLAGPPGTTTPTLQVAGGTTTLEKSVWGIGVGLRTHFTLSGNLSLYGQAQRRSISNVFEDGDPGRNQKDIGTYGAGFGLSYLMWW